MEASRFELFHDTDETHLLTQVVDPLIIAREAVAKLRAQGLPTVINRHLHVVDADKVENVEPIPQRPDKEQVEPDYGPQVAPLAVSPKPAPSSRRSAVAKPAAPKRRVAAKPKAPAVNKPPVRKRRTAAVQLALAKRMDKPFVDYVAAQDKHPSVFKAHYNSADGKDGDYMQAMVKHFSDDEAIMNRVNRVYRKPDTEQTSEYYLSDDTFGDFSKRAARYRLLGKDEEITLARNMKLGVAAYKKMKAAKDFNDDTLAGVAREGVYSYQALFHANLRLAIKPALAKSRAYPHTTKSDILSNAYKGLQRAIEKFDENRGWKFSTYAVTWIKQSIDRGIEQEAHIIRLPAHIAVTNRNISIARRDLESRLQRDPTLQELADETGTKIEVVENLHRVGSSSMASLNKPASDEGDKEIGDLLAAEESGETIHNELAEEDEFGNFIEQGGLTQQESIVLSLRHGVLLKGLIGVKIGPNQVDYQDALDNLPAPGGKPTLTSISDLLGTANRGDITKIEQSAMLKLSRVPKPGTDLEPTETDSLAFPVY